MIAVVSVSVFIICFTCLQSLYWGIEIVSLFIKSISDHYSVDFLGKGRVF